MGQSPCGFVEVYSAPSGLFRSNDRRAPNAAIHDSSARFELVDADGSTRDLDQVVEGALPSSPSGTLTGPDAVPLSASSPRQLMAGDPWSPGSCTSRLEVVPRMARAESFE